MIATDKGLRSLIVIAELASVSSSFRYVMSCTRSVAAASNGLLPINTSCCGAVPCTVDVQLGLLHPRDGA